MFVQNIYLHIFEKIFLRTSESEDFLVEDTCVLSVKRIPFKIYLLLSRIP